MKNPPLDAAALPTAAVQPGTRRFGDYVALTKPRLNFLVVLTSAAGYYLGAESHIDAWTMASAVAGTALVAGGAAVLNQVYEVDTDALMRRTRLRPLPDHRIGAADATVFGTAMSLSGLLLLAGRTNVLAAVLALATLVVYLMVYTPMKRRTSAATVVGAIPGALPPLIGWAASRGEVTAGGLSLFAIVFLWQIPHFMAIAWLYRDDYGKAGFPLLPVVEPDGRRTGRQAVAFAAALIPATLVPVYVGVAGTMYAVIALMLGAALLWLAVRFAWQRTDAAARQLFFASIIYLPLVWAAMIVNH